MNSKNFLEALQRSKGWKRTIAILLGIIARVVIAKGDPELGLAIFDVAILVGSLGIGHAVVVNAVEKGIENKKKEDK